MKDNRKAGAENGVCSKEDPSEKSKERVNLNSPFETYPRSQKKIKIKQLGFDDRPN